MENDELTQTVQSLQRQVNELQDQIATNKKESEVRIGEVDAKIGKREFLPPHQHVVDRINTKDLIGGFPVIASTPTYVAEEGTFRIYDNGVTRRLYIKVNQTWRYTDLT